MPKVTPVLLQAVVGIAVAVSNASADWPQFRGPMANGLTAGDVAPARWSETENIRWKVAVPGRGWSCPVTSGDKVFLTTAVAVGAPAEQAPQQGRGGWGGPDLTQVDHRFEVRCYKLTTGEELWTRVAFAGKPRIPTHPDNTFATETPVTDGERLYVSFGMMGIYCYDLEGELLWQKDLGSYPMDNGWGTASSPALAQGVLVVQVDNEEKSFAVGLDAATGDEKWRVERNERSSWSSPVVWTNSVRTEVVLGGVNAKSHDPLTGKELWSLNVAGRSSASPAAFGDLLYIGSEDRSSRGGPPGGIFAVKAGASGELIADGDGKSDSVLWSTRRDSLGMASPLVVDNVLYVFDRHGGMAAGFDATTGEPLFRERIRGAQPFWSAPWSYGGRVFAVDEAGTTFVVTPGAKFTEEAQNKLPGRIWSSPAVAGGCLLLRSEDTLYCIGGQSG